MATGVFISYRHGDCSGFADRISDRLRARLGRDRIVVSVDDIAQGADFESSLTERIGRSDAVVALIGRKWLTKSLEDPNDHVRIEIEFALARGIPVIPVLVDGAQMPRTEDLPDSLENLSRLNWIEISSATFDVGVERLLPLIEVEGAKLSPANRSAIVGAAWARGLATAFGKAGKLAADILELGVDAAKTMGKVGAEQPARSRIAEHIAVNQDLSIDEMAGFAEARGFAIRADGVAPLAVQRTSEEPAPLGHPPAVSQRGAERSPVPAAKPPSLPTQRMPTNAPRGSIFGNLRDLIGKLNDLGERRARVLRERVLAGPRDERDAWDAPQRTLWGEALARETTLSCAPSSVPPRHRLARRSLSRCSCIWRTRPNARVSSRPPWTHRRN
jgi:hypothetical protein